MQPFLGSWLGFLPLFQGPPYGIGMLAAGVILAIMILPSITSVSREVLLAVPDTQREAALGLGATRWETTRIAVLPYARSGLVGAILLGLGRALGETMAVTMVIGNRPEVAVSLFAPGYTMASVIANEFTEATADLLPLGPGRDRPAAVRRHARGQRAGPPAGLARGRTGRRGARNERPPAASRRTRPMSVLALAVARSS